MRISDWSADVCSSDLDPGLFGILAGDLGQFLAALLVQFGDRNADQGAVRLRIKAESAGGDRLLHRLHVRLVPDLHADHARLGHTDRADLVDRHHAAVDVDADRIEHADRGPAGTPTDEFVLQPLDSLAHAAFDFLAIRFRPDKL